VFAAVAAMVSAVVDLAARRSSQAARSTAEAETLSTLAGDVLRGESALTALLDRVRESFGMSSAGLLERDADRQGWHLVASSGTAPAPAARGRRRGRAGRGRPRAGAARPAAAAEDRRVLAAFGAQARSRCGSTGWPSAVAEAEPLAEVDRTRTALLAAVSHDLRSPLASAKAAVSALRSEGVQWSEPERAELLATADESLDRLSRLVENLLDLSRLQAGALAVFPQPVGLEDVLPAVLRELEPARVESTLELDLPEVRADPGLLERILVNVGTNAVRHSPPAARRRSTAARTRAGWRYG
jgi:two-component system sensor histidine kinase KdpD